MSELKKLRKAFGEVKEKMGLKAFEIISDYLYTLDRKLEDLEKSRNSWKRKYLELKKIK